MTKKLHLIFLLVSAFAFKTAAQTTDQFSLQHKVGFTVKFEHINLPFTKRLGEKRHLGFVVNYGLAKERERLYQFEHNFNLGYFKHKDFFQAAFINYKPSFGIQIGKSIILNIPIGVGYAFSIPTQRSYHQVDGTFVKSNPIGKSHFMPSLGLSVSLNLFKIVKIPFEFFTQYEMFSLAPYAAQGSLPFTIHTSSNFGIKYRLR